MGPLLALTRALNLARLLQQPAQLEARRLTMVKAYEAWRAATRAHVMRRVAAL